jgi:hypothetical protein
MLSEGPKQDLIRVERPNKGPCIFCLKSGVKFNKEHLPPENIAGEKSIELVNWVCSVCNGEFSKEDGYFGKYYHGAVCRLIERVTVKKGEGASIARKDLEAKYHPEINTIRFYLKRRPKPGEIEAANPELSPSGIGQVILEESREVSPRRLGKSLAKMAIETVAYLKPQAVLQADLNPIRKYARGQGPLKFLPYARGASQGTIGVKLCDQIIFGDEVFDVLVALLYLPGTAHAVQLSNHNDLFPLRYIAQGLGFILDEDGRRTKKASFILNPRRPMEQ